jgi:hypothetical protein
VLGIHCEISIQLSIYLCIHLSICLSSIYLSLNCIIVWFISLFFSFFPHLSTSGGFNKFQCYIFIFVWKVHHKIRPSLNFHLPSLLTSTLALTWPVLYSCPSFLNGLLVVLWVFCFRIVPVNILDLSQSKPLYHTSSPFYP